MRKSLLLSFLLFAVIRVAGQQPFSHFAFVPMHHAHLIRETGDYNFVAPRDGESAKWIVLLPHPQHNYTCT